MRVLVVAEQVGHVPAPVVAAALGAAWRRRHAEDTVTALFASDGGPGLLDAVARPEDTWLATEVAGPHGHPLEAALLVRDDGTAIIEAARAAAPELAPGGGVEAARATTYGVGELLLAAREAGARRILLGVGGVAAVDGGAGALTGLGFRLRVDDGSGLKIGAGDLHRVARIEPGWSADWDELEVVVLTDRDVTMPGLAASVAAGHPAGDDEPTQLAVALRRWCEVAVRDLAAGTLADRPGAGAGGGLAFGLAAALGGEPRPGVEVVWELQGGDRAVAAADLVAIAAPEGTPVNARATAAASAARIPATTLPSLPVSGLEVEDGAAIDALAEQVVGSIR